MPTIGQTIAVSGTKETTPGGEVYIATTSVTATPGTAVKPLVTNARNLEHRMMDDLIIRTAGTVRTVGLTSYTVADGFSLYPEQRCRRLLRREKRPAWRQAISSV